jgi:uncharacterized protein (TIGR03435 family)
VTLETVIKVAHGIMGPAFDPARQDDRISGPGWLTTERYNIVAKIPADTTKDDFKLMLQNLLAERFKLIMHRETKDASGYALVIAKNGLKMKESTDEANPQSGGPPPKFDVDQDGFRIFPPGRFGGDVERGERHHSIDGEQGVDGRVGFYFEGSMNADKWDAPLG